MACLRRSSHSTATAHWGITSYLEPSCRTDTQRNELAKEGQSRALSKRPGRVVREGTEKGQQRLVQKGCFGCCTADGPTRLRCRRPLGEADLGSWAMGIAARCRNNCKNVPCAAGVSEWRAQSAGTVRCRHVRRSRGLRQSGLGHVRRRVHRSKSLFPRRQQQIAVEHRMLTNM